MYKLPEKYFEMDHKHTASWITPFKKQCFVTAGMSMNMAGQGLVVGYAASLLPQLRAQDSLIPIDDAAGSWIASIVGFAVVVGNFIVPSIMSTYGRKTANVLSVTIMLVGWFGVVTSQSVGQLLAFRFLQGVAMGMATSVGPILIGEYTSPNNRGAFLATLSLAIAGGVLVVHSLGSLLPWQTTGLVISFITFTNLIIVLYSPESPSWLASQGRYEDCRKIFRWLRGYKEEDELEKIIENSMIIRESEVEADASKSINKNFFHCITNFKETVQKKEFYKPIFIMIHIYTMGQWAGANILSAYAQDIYHQVIGKDVDVTLMIVSVDAQRIISNACAVYVIRKVRRKTMLLITTCINIISFLGLAVYTYAKINSLLPYDHPLVGVGLIHLLMFSIATGTVPLPLIIAGELFPLEYRTFAGAISVFFYSSNLFLTIKTVPLLFGAIGVYGTFVFYACVVTYCLTVAMVFLPETKDRTLQDIEDEFRGRPFTQQEKASLTSRRHSNVDRRCSVPML